MLRAATANLPLPATGRGAAEVLAFPGDLCGLGRQEVLRAGFRFMDLLGEVGVQGCCMCYAHLTHASSSSSII